MPVRDAFALSPLSGCIAAPALTEAHRSGVSTPAPTGSKMRWDHQDRRENRGGCRKQLLDVHSKETATASALVSLRSAMVAPSTRGPKASRLATFELLSGVHDVYPLTPERLELVSAKLRAAGYRTADKYLGEGKARHIELGHRWTEALQLCLRRCLIACTRGMGPAKKAGEIRIAHVADMDEAGGEHHPEWPTNGRRAWLVACFWMLREIELSNLRVQDIEFQEQLARLRLPVSKCDQSGEGVVRTMHCICGQRLEDGGIDGHKVCPACALRSAVTDAQEAHPEAGGMSTVFHTHHGSVVEKRHMVACWRALAGDMTVTGHSARRSGAKMLCRCGWELWKNPISWPLGIRCHQGLYGRGVRRAASVVETATEAAQRRHTAGLEGFGCRSTEPEEPGSRDTPGSATSGREDRSVRS